MRRYASSEQRFDLGRHIYRVADLGVEQRLDTETITRGKQHAAALIPQREGKLAAQLPQATRTQIFIEMQRNFAVRSRGQTMTRGLQLLPNAIVIVELAVDHDAHALVFVCDWLVPSLEIDDAQTRMAHADLLVRSQPNLLPIRPSVVHGARTTEKRVFFHWPPSGKFRNKATHFSNLLGAGCVSKRCDHQLSPFIS